MDNSNNNIYTCNFVIFKNDILNNLWSLDEKIAHVEDLVHGPGDDEITKLRGDLQEIIKEIEDYDISNGNDKKNT